MADIRYIDKDFVRFNFTWPDGREDKETLAFGDKVEVLEEASSAGTPSRIRALELFGGTLEGTVKGRPFRTRDKGVLRFSMVDVQQGDGLILETPPDENHQTKLVFIDAGHNKLFARHVAARYQHRQSSKTNPLEVDLILITHADDRRSLRQSARSSRRSAEWPVQTLGGDAQTLGGARSDHVQTRGSRNERGRTVRLSRVGD